MEMNAPEFMPVLSSGAHRDPEEGACIMEYASFLSGDKWTDRPRCTNVTIALVAQVVNDSLGDEHRHLLLPLLPRLMATGSIDEWFRVSQCLMDWLMARTSPEFEGYECGDYPLVSDAVHDIVRYTHVGAEAAAKVSIQLLTDMLDEYDRLTGRTNIREITPEEYAACYALTAKKA